MVLDNHGVMSPAHRRSQNPISPSASLFRRSTTFSQDEPDLSWMALFKRHRFLLLTLALLAFLCTVYLYFAIKLGADSCSGLSAKEETLCRLKKSKTKASSGHRSTRRLLSFEEPVVELWLDIHFQGLWMGHLLEDERVECVRTIGCVGTDLAHLLGSNLLLVSLPAIECEEKPVFKGNFDESSLELLATGLLDSSVMFDLIICADCNIAELANDRGKLLDMGELHQGFFVSMSETSDSAVNNDSGSALSTVPMNGCACLSRNNGGRREVHD